MSPAYGYGVAVDAGSSGSRIYLYRWPRDEPSGTFVKVEREALFRAERLPGINDEHGIGIDLLEDLVALATDALPSGVDPGEVPIYLGATAGMRIIDPEAEADIMSRVRTLLHRSEFLFRDEWARTISGEEEGAYDWLVANYLKNDGNFPTSETTYGALDLGGASTQISFPVSSAVAYQFPLRIEDVKYPLYTQSFLYYGVDQARMKYDKEFATPTMVNPCYPTGYTDADSGVSGSSNWTFVYAWDFLGLKVGPDTDDLQALNVKAQRICNMPHRQQIAWYQRHMQYKSEKPHAQCWNAAFSCHLLHKTYGMPLSDTPIEIYDDINGTKVQWALGLMLVEANKLGSIFKESGQQLDFYGAAEAYTYVFLMSAAALILLTWAFRYVPCRLKQSPDDEESLLPSLDLSSPRKGR